MECHSIADAAVPASSIVEEPTVNNSKHGEHAPITLLHPDGDAAVANAAPLTNDTFERVDSVMNGEGAVAPGVPGKDSEFIPMASAVPSAAVAKAMETARGRGVRILGLHEWKEAALSLAEAFEKDHSSLYFLDTPERAHWSKQQKWDLHLKIMEYVTYAHLLNGLVVSAGPNYECVGLWMPPGKNTDSPLTSLRSGLWRLNYLLCREGRKRFFTEFLPLLTDTKLQVLGPRTDLDSWYLVYIGTRPSGRGKGYARKVIEHVTKIADRDGKCCYLESSNEVNRQIYGKMGFWMVKNIYLQRAEEHVELDIMVREPVSGSKM